MRIQSLPNRRTLIGSAGGVLLLGSLGKSTRADQPGAAWKMGVISDLHFGLAPDALPRLERFMESVSEVKPDSIMQLGDFNFGVDAKPCMNLWEQFDGPKYHVLGNHDMDKVTKAAMVEFLQLAGSYYSFDHKGWHFIVLDRNFLRTSATEYKDYSKANFYVASQLRGHANPDQLEWLEEDLKRTNLPTVVFSHQGLGVRDSAPGSPELEIESVLARANAESKKVKACFCGHHHVDRYNLRSGIHYVWINSASYHWVGADYGRMAPYTDPLYTFLTFHPDESIEIRAAKSEWAAPTPQERGISRMGNAEYGDRCKTARSSLMRRD